MTEKTLELIQWDRNPDEQLTKLAEDISSDLNDARTKKLVKYLKYRAAEIKSLRTDLTQSHQINEILKICIQEAKYWTTTIEHAQNCDIMVDLPCDCYMSNRPVFLRGGKKEEMFNLPKDGGGAPYQAMGYVLGLAQTISVTTSSAISAAFNANTRVITIYTTVDCYIRQTAVANDAALNTDHFIPAKTRTDISLLVNGVYIPYLAVLGTGSGSLYISERG